MKVFIYETYGSHKFKFYFNGFHSNVENINNRFELILDYSSPVFGFTSRPKPIKSIKEFLHVYRPGRHIEFMTNKKYKRMVESW